MRLIANSSQLDDLERRINDIEAGAFSKFDILRERFLGKKEDVETARTAFADWRKLRDEQFRLIRTQGLGMADKSFLLTEQNYAEDLRKKIQKVVDFSAWKALDFVQTADREKARANTIMMVILGATVLAGLLVAFLITRSITSPLKLIVRRMKDISTGDLRHEVEIYQKDEVGELADSFRSMQAGLRSKAELASMVAAGDFSQRVEVSGKDDVLGNSINEMTANLARSEAERSLQDWIKTGKNELNEIIAGKEDISCTVQRGDRFSRPLSESPDRNALSLIGSWCAHFERELCLQ